MRHARRTGLLHGRSCVSSGFLRSHVAVVVAELYPDTEYMEARKNQPSIFACMKACSQTTEDSFGDLADLFEAVGPWLRILRLVACCSGLERHILSLHSSDTTPSR